MTEQHTSREPDDARHFSPQGKEGGAAGGSAPRGEKLEARSAADDKVLRMGSASIPKLILEFAIPSVVGMLINGSYAIIDSVFLGHAVGEIGLSAMTVANPIMVVFMAIAMLVGNGGNALAALRLGAGSALAVDIDDKCRDAAEENAGLNGIGPDRLSVLPQDLRQHGQQRSLHPLHPHGQHLHGEQIVELVHRQSRKGVRLAEDDAAAVQVLGIHDGFPVLPGPLELPAPESQIKAVVCVAGEEAHTDLGPLREKACAQIPSLFAEDVHQTAVFRLTLRGQHLLSVDPGVSPENGGLRLGGDGVSGIGSLCLHIDQSFRKSGVRGGRGEAMGEVTCRFWFTISHLAADCHINK